MVPEGEFALGFDPSNKVEKFISNDTLSLNAQPSQKIFLKSFYLDQFEVTYEAFNRYKPKLKYEIFDAKEPIRGVSWYEADAYCLAQGKRLPTEFEWEKAARGINGKLFVWGDQFEQNKANFSKKVRVVGSTSSDTSTYGISDLNGNVSEWTSSWYDTYKASNFRDKLYGKKVKVIRGDSFHKMEHGLMKEFTILYYRNYAPPYERFWDTGFRCAQSV